MVSQIHNLPHRHSALVVPLHSPSYSSTNFAVVSVRRELAGQRIVAIAAWLAAWLDEHGEFELVVFDPLV